MLSLVIIALDRVVSSSNPAMGELTAITDFGLVLGPVVIGIIVHSTTCPIMFLCLAFTGMINLSHFYFFVKEKRMAL